MDPEEPPYTDLYLKERTSIYPCENLDCEPLGSYPPGTRFGILTYEIKTNKSSYQFFYPMENGDKVIAFMASSSFERK